MLNWSFYSSGDGSLQRSRPSTKSFRAFLYLQWDSSMSNLPCNGPGLVIVPSDISFFVKFELEDYRNRTELGKPVPRPPHWTIWTPNKWRGSRFIDKRWIHACHFTYSSLSTVDRMLDPKPWHVSHKIAAIISDNRYKPITNFHCLYIYHMIADGPAMSQLLKRLGWNISQSKDWAVIDVHLMTIYIIPDEYLLGKASPEANPSQSTTQST